MHLTILKNRKNTAMIFFHLQPIEFSIIFLTTKVNAVNARKSRLFSEICEFSESRQVIK